MIVVNVIFVFFFDVENQDPLLTLGTLPQQTPPTESNAGLQGTRDGVLVTSVEDDPLLARLVSTWDSCPLLNVYIIERPR